MGQTIGPGPTGRTATEFAPDCWLGRGADGRPPVIAPNVSEADARLLVDGGLPAWLAPDLSDEQVGKLWADAHGKRPRRFNSPVTHWRWDVPLTDLPDRPHALPAAFWGRRGALYVSEADAFAALGRAVKALAAVVLGVGR